MTEIVKSNKRVPDPQNAPERGFHKISGKTDQSKIFSFSFFFFFFFAFF